MTNFDKAIEIVNTEIAPIYTSWYPLEHKVQEARALRYETITQMGCIYFESRDQTHFIAGTMRLYDLYTPMEYEHKVFIYNQDKSEWSNVFYGRELECRAFVIAWQSKHYGFDYSEYIKGKGQLKLIENRLAELSSEFTPQNEDTIQELIETIKRSVRLKLDLAEDQDLPPLSIEQATEGM